MKKKYLLDTNICVFCMRGKFEMNRKIALAGIDNCYLSEITVAELYYGAENSDNPKKTMRETEDFISLFRVIPFGKSLHTFGREMAYLKSIGRKIENFDMAIGSIALQHKMVMVTDNVDHFGRIRGIEIEDWKAEEPRV
ncbi:MAG: PIN domain-containing protein [Prevotella sp.]|nr:PIN domain-containing protein [Prevotella sp.]